VGNVFINPNFHVILVHLPLGVFVLGVVIELMSFMYRRSTLRLAGRWMILLGALATIPVAFTGIYALNDIAERSQADARLPDNATWAQVAGGARLRGGTGAPQAHLVTNALHSPETQEVWRLFSRHIWVEGPASALVALTAVLYLGLSDRMRRRLYFPALILLVGGAGLMTWGAWYAGESIYRFGSATRLQRALPAPPPAEAHSTGPATVPAAAISNAVPAAILPAADSVPPAHPLPQLPPFHLSPAIILSPTSEPSSEPTTNPATEPATTAPATEPTTEPATAPTTSPAPIPAAEPTPAPSTNPASPTAAPAPETAPAPTQPSPAAPETAPASPPTTASAPETTLPTTIPAVIVPPPIVPPPGIFRPLAEPPPLTLPSLPLTPSTGVPVTAIPAPREVEENKVEEVGTPAYYVGPPLQIHLLLAGFSVAFAVGALGASMRRLALLAPAPVPATPDEAAHEAEETEAVLAANNATAGRRPVTGQDIDLLRSINPDLSVTAVKSECVCPATIWLFAFLGFLLTASIGVYLLAAPASLGGDGIPFNFHDLWSAIIDKSQNPDGLLTRRLAHVIGGAALLLLPLLLAIFAKWSRSKVALGLTSLLLIAVIAGQVWIGVLMLYDSRLGNINHFNSAPVTPARVTSPV
jgi:uncharacterized membrane protein